MKLTKGEVARVLAGELEDFMEELEAEEKRAEAGDAAPRGRSRASDALGGAVDALTAAGCDTPRLTPRC